MPRTRRPAKPGGQHRDGDDQIHRRGNKVEQIEIIENLVRQDDQ
jgi:hypothetical protein